MYIVDSLEVFAIAGGTIQWELNNRLLPCCFRTGRKGILRLDDRGNRRERQSSNESGIPAGRNWESNPFCGDNAGANDAYPAV